MLDFSILGSWRADELADTDFYNELAEMIDSAEIALFKKYKLPLIYKSSTSDAVTFRWLILAIPQPSGQCTEETAAFLAKIYFNDTLRAAVCSLVHLSPKDSRIHDAVLQLLEGYEND